MRLPVRRAGASPKGKTNASQCSPMFTIQNDNMYMLSKLEKRARVMIIILLMQYSFRILHYITFFNRWPRNYPSYGLIRRLLGKMRRREA